MAPWYLSSAGAGAEIAARKERPHSRNQSPERKRRAKQATAKHSGTASPETVRHGRMVLSLRETIVPATRRLRLARRLPWVRRLRSGL